MSAFTIAFQVPNLVRSLFADAALQAAFVPVFTEQLEHRSRAGGVPRRVRAAVRDLGRRWACSRALFVLLAPVIMPLFAPGFDEQLTDLTVNLAQLLFPIVLLLGLSGLVVGILNSFDQFAVPAIAPLFWNLAIIATLIVLTPQFEGDDRIYAYAIGVLIGTVVQLLLPLPWLRRTGFRHRAQLQLARRARDARAEADVPGHDRPRADQLQPVGGQHLRDADLGGGAGRDRQGVPHLHAAAGRVRGRARDRAVPDASRGSRRAATPTACATVQGSGTRQMLLLLVPCAALMMVLSEPITRIIYQRGEFDAAQTDLVSEALFFFALSLPFAGVNLILIRTFFSLQRPWTPTLIALGEPRRERRPRRAALRADGDRRHHARDRDRLADHDGRAGARPARARSGGLDMARTLDVGIRDAGRRGAAGGRRARRAGGARRASATAWSTRSWSWALASVAGLAAYAAAVLAMRIDEAHQICGARPRPARAAAFAERRPYP